MRFAGGAVGVGSPTAYRLLLMALPSFCANLCNFEEDEIERKKYAHWYFSALLFFSCTGQSCTEYSEKRMSCRILLYKERCTVTDCGKPDYKYYRL